MRLLGAGIVLWAALAPGSRGGAQSAPSLFREATREVKLDFVHDAGESGTYVFPEIMGSGAALFDYDGDGDLDVYLVQGGGPPEPKDARRAPNRLFRREADGSFTDVTGGSGLGDTGYGAGVAVGDVDNDGDLDVYVSNYGPDALYRNEGNGTFVNVSERAGISGDFWSASAVFCDYDADGFLDLYVTHYVAYDPRKNCVGSDGSPDYCSPQSFPGTSDRLYRNRGDGRFEDVSRSSGIAGVAAPGLGVVCADFNRDGLLDFYVANDGEANQLWENQGDGTFRDQAFLNGVALNGMGQAEAGMGVTLGDVEGDGDLDIFFTHSIDQHNTLYVNEEALGFEDRSTAAGVAAVSLPMTGFGTGFLDYDHDGDLNLAIANGRVYKGPILPSAAVGPFWNPYAEPNHVLENDGSGRFQDASAAAGSFASQVEVSRGLALGDVDGDGDVDLLLTNSAGPARLFVNQADKKGSWLIMRAYDPELRRDAHGAEVTVSASGKDYLRIANPGYGYLSSNDPRAHFGIAGARSADRIRIRWPDGSEEVFPGTGLDRVVVLEKGKGKPAPE